MAVLTKEDYMARLKEKVGDDTSDEAMSFLEDMTDTFNDMETRSNGKSEEEWKTEIKNLDDEWRKKYKERFFSETTPNNVKEEQKEDIMDDSSEVDFDDLFAEKEG